MPCNFETVVVHAFNTEEADESLGSAVYIRKIPLQLHMSKHCYGSLKTLYVWLMSVDSMSLLAGKEHV